MLRMVMTSLPNALVTVKDDHATLTPKLPAGPNEPDMGSLFKMELVKANNQWHVRLQDSADFFKTDFDGNARIQAEITMSEAAAGESVAGQIEKGAFKDAKEAMTTFNTARETAADKVMEQLKAQSASPAQSQPRP